MNLKILPVNVEEWSSRNVPVEPAKVTEAESAAVSSSVAPVPIVADPDVPARACADLQRRAGCSVETDDAVAVQVLPEDRLQRLQCVAGSRHGAAGQISFVVAVTVGAPHRVLAGTGILPGNVIAARCLNRADRRPRCQTHRR